METIEIRTLIITLTCLFLLLGIFVLIFFSVYKRNQNMKERQIESLNKEILQTQLEIQEQTLKTISQEIHDNIGQMLSLAKLNLALAEAEQEDNANSKITDSHQLVSKAIQDLRDLSRSLNTDYVSEMGLQRSIEYELEMIRKTGTMKTTLQVEGQIKRLDKQKELILFRIVQESLNNIIKHAGADELTVELTYLPHQLYLSIKDNGKGVDLTPLNENTSTGIGLGIRNMHNRAKLIGGDFKMSSTLGVGTQVTIELSNE
ncbi:MAG TPA: sensor histidine kinase [Chitinophagaceae bacterium]